MLLSYDDDEIGSCMTTNYICIPKGLSVRQAMSELVRQAGTNDNISTIYVLDESLKFAGAIDLKDLIIAREHDVLDDIIVHSYPSVTDHEKIDECMEKIMDYSEDSTPVLSQDGHMLGVITSEDIVEMVDNEMGGRLRKTGRSHRRRRSQRNHGTKHEKTSPMAHHPAVPRDARFLCCRCL